MPILKGWRKSAAPIPMFKTPFLNHAGRNPLLGSLGKIIGLVAALIFVLQWFGSPAVLVSYDWNGRAAAPVYYNCTYFNLMSGFETFIPSDVVDDCPALRLYEVSASDLLSLTS